MGSGALGLQLMQNEFSTARMRAVWDDKNRLKKILAVERAVASAQAEMGIIPKAAAEEINKVAQYESLNLKDLYISSAKAGHFLSGMVTYLQELLGKEYGEYIHYGMTSQDVLDTGTILQLKDAHQIFIEKIQQIASVLKRLAKEYKDVATVGRAHGTHSPAVTIGFRFAVSLNELDRYLTRLKEIEDFVFTGVISGVVGTHASMGDKGIQLEKAVLEALDLNVPEIYWHTQRDRFVEYAHILTQISSLLGKIGKDLFEQSRTEIAEFNEPYSTNRQGSTAVPTMRNPYLCEAVMNLGGIIRNEMRLMYDAMDVLHEKDTIAWRNIWVALPNICMYLSGQINYAYVLLNKGTFNLDNIEKNLYLDGGSKMSERIMMYLAPEIGKQTAHQLLYQIAENAKSKNISFEHELKQDERVLEHTSLEVLEELLDPHSYTGTAQAQTLAIIKSFQQRHPEIK